ncbi:MAG: hypothetical protein Q8M76_18600, partial [Spirochaetaceae bacterium]|nr:hypothetical protein [Spirochaetaceae bacterium]
MEKTACYLPRVTSGKSGMAATLAFCLAASCAVPHEAYLVGDREERKELSELFALVDEAGSDVIQRFAAIRQISTRLLAKREYGKLTALLTSLAGSAADAPAADPYSAWYLFTTAYAFEKQGSSPIAALYYDRIVKNWPDVVVDGRSVHFECLSRLIETSNSPERKIE